VSAHSREREILIFKLVPLKFNYIKYSAWGDVFFASLLVSIFQAMILQHQDCQHVRVRLEVLEREIISQASFFQFSHWPCYMWFKSYFSFSCRYVLIKILTLVLDIILFIQDYWVFGLCPSSGILKITGGPVIEASSF
jgi:hypothetical protein